MTVLCTLRSHTGMDFKALTLLVHVGTVVCFQQEFLLHSGFESKHVHNE